MTKYEIAKLPEEDQAFIYAYGLEKKSKEEVEWLKDPEHLNYTIYQGWI